MSKYRARRTALLAATTLSFWAALGCEHAPEMLGDDDMFTSGNDAIAEDEEVMASQALSNGERSSMAWPEGWMVVQHEEWIPVLDELGQRLHAARESFLNGDRTTTDAEVRRGLVVLEAQLAEGSDRDRAALERSIATLWVIADRLSDQEAVSLEQLDVAFANAYRSELERASLVVNADSTVPYLDRPETHLQRAVELFLVDEDDEAALEVDKASAYMHLEGNRLCLGERDQLIEAAQALEHVAARLRLRGIRERTELDDVFEPVIHLWLQIARTSAPPQSLGATE